MKPMAKLYVPLLVIAAFLGVALFMPKSASAALEGENGPILYIENSEQTPSIDLQVTDCDGDCIPVEEPQVTNSVSTTNPDGTDQIVAVETTDPIDDATISSPSTTGDYSVVYATQTPVCQNYSKESVLDDAILPNYCSWENSSGSDAVLNIVTIDSARNPASEPSVVVTFTPLYEEIPTYNAVNELSFSPDGENVLVTRSSTPTSYHDGWIDDSYCECDYLPTLWTIENVNIRTGVVTTVVAPRFDPYLNGGYADNGNIYFSKLNEEYKNIEEGLYEESWFQVDIWVILAGQTEQTQLTDTTDISEFYIDASPDSSKLLVVDVNDCYYYQGFSSNNCTYYYVATANGSFTQAIVAANFTPVFFSPDGLSLIGTVNDFGPALLRSLTAYDSNVILRSRIYTASAFRTSLTETAFLSDTVQVREWAPKFIAATTTTTPTPTPVEQLAVTGLTNLYILIAAITLIVSTLGMVFFSKKKIA